MIHTDGKPTIVSGNFRAAKRPPLRPRLAVADMLAADFGPLLRKSAEREAKDGRR